MKARTQHRRGTVLFMVVGLLAMLFIVVSAYIVLARIDRTALTDSHRAHLNERILNTATDVTLSSLRQQWTDPQGNFSPENSTDPNWGVQVTYEDRPGQLGAKAISSPEPVLDHNLEAPPPVRFTAYRDAITDDYAKMDNFRYPGYTQLSTDSNLPGPTLMTLMLDRQIASRNELANVPSYVREDIRQNALVPFMDADGDGLPDAFFPAMKLINDMANAMAGVSVDAPVRYPVTGQPQIFNTVIPQSTGWTRFDQQAPYEIAMRLLPHGGMIDLSAATYTDASGNAQQSWAFQFVTGMFNYRVRNNARSEAMLGSSSGDLSLLQRLRQQSGAVEPKLRFRGGLLESYEPAGNQSNQYAIPESLKALQTSYRYSVRANYNDPQYPPGRRSNNWQRFNLAPQNGFQFGDWPAYMNAAYLDPIKYGNPLSFDTNVLQRYGKRQLITTVNTSDENSRVQTPLTNAQLAMTPPPLGLAVGQQKFNLHRIADPATGVFVPDPSDPNRLIYDHVRGDVMVRELASYFYDMLGGYDGFVGDATVTEPVSRIDQANMLAVNTIAFAAPRTINGTNAGFVDVVSYVPAAAGTTKWYIGYGPQPVITQVLAHRDDSDEVELGVELYNPNDPEVTSGTDKHALMMSQFAISLDNRYDAGARNANTWIATNLKVLDSTTAVGLSPLLPGRTFQTVIFKPGGGAGNIQSAITSYVTRTPGVINDTVLSGPQTPGNIVVKLWRRSAATPPVWYLVDRMEVEKPAANDSQNPQGTYATAWRDTRTETYWPASTNALVGRARWRCMIDAPESDGLHSTQHNMLYLHQENTTSGNFDRTIHFGEEEDPTSGAPFNYPAPAPSPLGGTPAPLYVADAGVGSIILNGAARPPSFPTPGFMLFVPRFSHFEDPTLDENVAPPPALARKPMSRTLYDDFTNHSGYTLTPASNVPADFGHMPIFDNNQRAKGELALPNPPPAMIPPPFQPTTNPAQSYFDWRLGDKVPWGLLAFDYFTTLNAADPNGDGSNADKIDPSQVHGRININEAPWLMLASLPVLGPDTTGNLSIEPSTNPVHMMSPAFWNKDSCILVSVPQAIPADNRFMTNLFELDSANNSVPPTWRLGASLAISAAGYRDRAQVLYASGDSRNGPYYAPYVASHTRNSTVDKVNWGAPPIVGGVYREARYGRVRGQANPLFAGVPTNVPKDPELNMSGFVALGELVNVKGFDQTQFDAATGAPPPAGTILNRNDFMKSVSLMALLDTQFLTTRSNTFTLYTTLTDRQNPQASIRSQVTIDRSNIVPKVATVSDNTTAPPTTRRMTIKSNDPPALVTEREVGYYNVKYDE